MRMLPLLILTVLACFPPMRVDAADAPSITNGTVTVTWNEEISQIEIADAKGVYAVVPPIASTYNEDKVDEKLRNFIEERKQLDQKANRESLVLALHETGTVYRFSLSKKNQEKSFVRVELIIAPYLFFSNFSDHLKKENRNMELSDSIYEHLDIPPIELRLPKNADQLKSFGTAGLKAVDGHKGSYMFLSVVDPETNAGVVSGWLTASEASGIVFSEKSSRDRVRIDSKCQYGKKFLTKNSYLASETFIIGRFDDCREGLEQYAELVAKEAEVQLKPIPAGYCTWYSDKYGGACDETHIRELADFAAAHLKPFGFNFVQIDDHWQDGVKTNGPKKIFTRVNPKGPYPNGMTPTAKMLAEHGFMAGLWFMPFAGNVDDPHFPKEWYVKSAVTDEVDAAGKSKRHYNNIVNKEGEPYESYWGGTSLDMTNPDVQKYLRDEVSRIYSDWGYNYFKLDGLWTGMACDQLYVNNEFRPDDLGKVKFFDEKGHTPVSAYRKGLEIIREAAPDAFILGCNVSQNMRMMHPSIGFCDAMRIGPDNGSDWNSLKAGPWHGSNRYFLNGRVWWNDPDPVYVRASMPLEHAQLIASWVAISGQLYAFSDWLPELPKERLEILQKTIRPHGLTTVRPVDLFESDLPRIWHLWDDKSGVRRDVVAFYNWDDTNSVTIETTAEKLGLPQAEKYVAFDFWGNSIVKSFDGKNIRIELPPGSCRVLSVRPVIDDRLILLSTSQHVTQGIIDVISEKWDETDQALDVEIMCFNDRPTLLTCVLPNEQEDYVFALSVAGENVSPGEIKKFRLPVSQVLQEKKEKEEFGMKLEKSMIHRRVIE